MNSRPLNILHVDDDGVSRMVMHHLLRELGHAPQGASSAAEALALAADQVFDLVISDVHMPDIGGVELRDRLAALSPETAGVPVVAVTADVMTRGVDEFRALGFAGVMAKPLIVARLREIIEAATAPRVERTFAAAGFSKGG